MTKKRQKVIHVNGYKNVNSVIIEQFLSNASCLFLSNFSARQSASMPVGTCTKVATYQVLGGSALRLPPQAPTFERQKAWGTENNPR